jgi:glutathione S-transferase
VQLTLYGFPASHPVQAVRGMLEYKHIAFRFVELVPGTHPARLRAAGFRGITVPALEVDGEKVQGSTRISRRLEALAPEPSLYGADPDTRRAVEEAERWAEAELQPIHRLAYRRALVRRRSLRGAISLPRAVVLATLARATGSRVRRHLAALPAALDHVDALIAAGTIGRPDPNAADFQIGATVWALLSFDDFRPLVVERPAARLAQRFTEERPRVPAFLPKERSST